MEFALKAEDGAAGTLIYSVELSPSLIEYEREDRIALPHEATPWNERAARVEGKLVRFVASHLSTQRDPAHQRDIVHKDPVCRLPERAAVAPQSAAHKGRMFYFSRSSGLPSPCAHQQGPPERRCELPRHRHVH